MACSTIEYSKHGLVQMLNRGLSVEEVEAVIQSGEVLREYPEDRPYPSRLMYLMIDSRPIHVVVSEDFSTDICTVITAYEPGTNLWYLDFKTRKN